MGDRIESGRETREERGHRNYKSEKASVRMRVELVHWPRPGGGNLPATPERGAVITEADARGAS